MRLSQILIFPKFLDELMQQIQAFVILTILICNKAIISPKNSSKTMRISLISLAFLLVSASCRMTESMGFYQPMTLNMKVPDGPPEFKAGWHAGCKSAASNQAFANGFVYQGKGGPDYGSGVYQHDPYFGIGWRAGFASCVAHIGTFLAYPSMQHAPLSSR